MSIDRVRILLQTRLASDCPSFATIYGRPPAPFLTRIATRADCLAGRAYAQDFVLCPPAVCGNGMQEATEGCDDGNRTSGDGCRNDCRLE
jgi:cysteine-rich repeat protein